VFDSCSVSNRWIPEDWHKIDQIHRCIGQAIWIYTLESGLQRIPNDAFDIRFGKGITRSSPAIWDDMRQDFIHNAHPIPVHSHNDERRRIPLFEALGSGCVSVEADVHFEKGDLLVGHSARGLHKEASLRSMYLDPLQRMLLSQNALTSPDEAPRGIYMREPSRSVVLLVDQKSAGPETFAELYKQLQPLRELDYLAYWNGTARVTRPLTIVATGKTPFESVLALPNDHRDIFWDAHLERLPSAQDDFTVDPPLFKYNKSNSYYASTKYRNAIFRGWQYINNDNVEQSTPGPAWNDIRGSQLEQAASRGLLTRVWDAPAEPPNLRDVVLRNLMDEKVDIINMDDMGLVRDRARGWGSA
jgi:hypothetical protein